MASVWIMEFDRPTPHGGNAPSAQLPWVAIQKITIGASTQSSAFNAATTFVALTCDGDCLFAGGANPTAAANTAVPLPAGAWHYFGVFPGHKIAVWDGSS